MPRPSLFLLSLALGAICAIALGACGSDDEGTIPPDNAQAMLDALGDAQGEQDEGDCDGLADAAGNLLADAEELPESVDTDVRTALEEGAQNLQALANDKSKCEPTGTTGPTGPETETTEEVAPEFTETTTTETTTTEEEKPPKPEKPPKVPEQPPDEGQGPPGGVPPGQEEDGGPPTGGTEEDD